MKKVMVGLSLAMAFAVGAFADSVADVRAFIEKQAAESAAGNFKAAMDNVPVAYRNDFDMIAKKFAGKIDSELWNETASLVDTLAEALGSKAEFLADTLQQGDFSDLSKNERIEMLKGSCGILSALAKTLTYDRIKQPNVFGALSEPKVAAAMQKFQKVPFLQQYTTNPKILDARAVENGVEVTFALPKDKKQSVVFTNVDGKWMDAEFVRNWPTYKGQALQWIDGLKIDDKFRKQFKSITPMMKMAAEQIKGATSAEEAQKSIAMMVLPLVMLGGNTSANLDVKAEPQAVK